MGTSAGKLADSESSEAADEEEDPFSLEGNVQDHIKALKSWIRQFETGSMTVKEDLMEERKKLWNATRSLSAARADVSHLKEELETWSQTLLYTRLEQPPELITFGIHVECIEFSLHLAGDSAKESCQHTVLLDTSNFDGHDSRGKEKETGASELWCWHCASWDTTFLRRTLPCALVWTRALCQDYTAAGRKFCKHASMSFPFGRTRLRFRKVCQLLQEPLSWHTCHYRFCGDWDWPLSQPDTQSLTWFDYQRRTFKSCIIYPFTSALQPVGLWRCAHFWQLWFRL